MKQHRAEASIEDTAPQRRRVLMLLSRAACGGLALALAGCAEGTAESWDRPDWFRAKRGTTGNGGRR